MIDYKIKNASEIDLYLHLEKASHLFVPPLASRVNLKEYAQKLYEKAQTFEAWDQDNLIGLFAGYFNLHISKEVFVTNVSVLEQYKNKGIASQLLIMVKIFAVHNGYDKIRLEVNSKNTQAIQFYTKHQFVIDVEEGESVFMNLKL